MTIGYKKYTTTNELLQLEEFQKISKINMKYKKAKKVRNHSYDV